MDPSKQSPVPGHSSPGALLGGLCLGPKQIDPNHCKLLGLQAELSQGHRNNSLSSLRFYSRLHMDTNRFALENKGDFKSCGNQYLKKTQITPWGICTKRQFSESKVQNDKAFLLREGWAGSFHHLPLICSRVLCSGVKSSLVQQAKLMSCEIPGHNPTLHVPECPCWPNNPTGGMNSKCACRGTGTATSAWKGVSFQNPNSLQC